MHDEKIKRPAPVDSESVRAFYDEFADSRMLQYLSEENPRIEKAIARILPYVGMNSIVLEIGCGIGLVTERIAAKATKGSIWACDISERNISYARQRVRLPNVQFRRYDAL